MDRLHIHERMLAALTLTVGALGMSGAIADRLAVASEHPAPSTDLQQSALNYSYLRRRVWGGDTTGEPLSDGLTLDPSDPQPTNRAERRAQMFGNVARAFSNRPPRSL